LFTIWLVFHVIVSAGLVLVVLLQSSKGEGLAGSAFGGGGGGMGGAVFGGRGAASFLSKATQVLAILFMINCGALAYMSASTSAGDGAVVTDGETSVVTQQAQAERDRALQQQAAQQQLADSLNATGDTANPLDIKIIDQTVTPVDTSGN
jgi:preprotein translocase subunit SecG